jgi:OOP family OmpA-OmpF porin
MLSRHKLLLIATSLILYATLVTAQQPVKDHPLVSRFPGSTVLEYKTAEFDEFLLPLGKIIDASKFTKSEKIDGKVTKFKYSIPENASTLVIAKSYQDALQNSGFQVLFQCSGDECADKSAPGNSRDTDSGRWCYVSYLCDQPMRYLAAKLSRASGDAYVALVVNKGFGTWLTIVEVKPMEGGLVKVNAAALASDIAKTGHASVYGIYFDSGKAVLKPESDATLAEISKLLASNVQLKLHVVGHTDNVGTLASNIALSKQRADAVVAALATQYHVAQTRLQAAGVGPLAPVTTNKTEDGRAKNRRVELVEE